MGSLRTLAVLIVLARAARADTASVDVDENLGILSATHTTLVAGYAHAVDDRIFVEAQLGAGTTGSLVVAIARGGIGVVLHPSHRIELRLGWRVGDTYLHGDLGNAPFSVHLLAVEIVPQLALDLADHWKLRAVPLAPTVYWHHSYGGAVALELGVERAL